MAGARRLPLASTSAIDRDRIKLMANQVRELFGAIPEDLETFALASQITQAEAKKFFIESTRLRKWRDQRDPLVEPDRRLAAVLRRGGGLLFREEAGLPLHPALRSGRCCLIVGEPGTGKYLPVVACNDTRRAVDVRYRVWDAETDETVAEGACRVPANQNWQVGRLRTFASDQRLYLIEWELDGQRFGNHYLVGTPPFKLERYKGWLGKITSADR